MEDRNPLVAILAALVVAVVVWVALGTPGIGDDDQSTSVAQGPPSLLIVSPDDKSTFTKPSIVVTGTAAANSIVEFGHVGRVPVSASGDWSTTLALSPGRNKFYLRDIVGDQVSEPQTLTIKRKLTSSERDAIEAELEKEVKDRAAFTRYIRNSKRMNYAELSKDPDAIAGRKVHLHGQVFQIQEDSNESYLLMGITDNGFEWVDTVWVNYGQPSSVQLNEMVDVYGTVVGLRQYDSAKKGVKEVPEVDAKYVVKAP